MPSTLLHEQANACLATWLAQLPKTPLAEVVLDASALTEFDSSALAVLLGLRRALIAQGRVLRVEGMTRRLRELAVLYGVIDLLPST